MQTGGVYTKKVSSFFTFSVLAIVIILAILYIGMPLGGRAAAVPTAAAEGFSYAKKLAEDVSKGTVAPAPPLLPKGVAAPPQATVGKEGFFAGPTRGSGEPNCLRANSDLAALYGMMLEKASSTEEGPDDLRELQVLLSKLACFKQDLMGAAGVVQATRYQPFSTSHDMESVAETTARCFAKTIPQRDLMLAFDKWGSRGTLLIKRLCTSFDLTDAEEEEALAMFGRAMADVGDVAMGQCCNAGVAVIAGETAQRMVGGYEAPGLNELREYKGYY
jgi:hypothetical protein